MSCPRCHGLLIFSTCHDHERTYLGARCLNCGNYLDAMLLYNRQHRPAHGWALDETHPAGKRAFRRNYTGRESAYDARHA